MKIKILLLCTVLFILSGCEPVYKAANFREVANGHKIVAVLPPNVIIEIKNSSEKDKIDKQESLESERFQNALVDYITLHYNNKDIFVNAQSVSETNRILSENNITTLTGRNYQDLAALLNVDAVVVSRISLANPLTNSEAFFTGLLAGPIGVHSKISTVDLSLTDKNTGKMFWNYNWETGGTFISSEKLTNSLMKSAAYKFPYKTNDLK